jgi:hypothetical protein
MSLLVEAMKTEIQIREEIERLRNLTTAQLKEKYREVFGEESRSNHKQFLFRRIAWRIQANAWGGLSERARRRALEIADDADLRICAPKNFLREAIEDGRTREARRLSLARGGKPALEGAGGRSELQPVEKRQVSRSADAGLHRQGLSLKIGALHRPRNRTQPGVRMDGGRNSVSHATVSGAGALHPLARGDPQASRSPVKMKGRGSYGWNNSNSNWSGSSPRLCNCVMQAGTSRPTASIRFSGSVCGV